MGWDTEKSEKMWAESESGEEMIQWDLMTARCLLPMLEYEGVALPLAV